MPIENKNTVKITMYPIKTKLIKQNDNLLEIILEGLTRQNLTLENRDILVIAETALSTSQGNLVEIEKVSPSRRAIELSRKYEIEPRIVEIILNEADKIFGGVKGCILAEKNGLLLANAGIDSSNVPIGYVSLLPKNPKKSIEKMRLEILKKTKKKIGIILADSRTQPLRKGVIGIAIATTGFEPVLDLRGKKDLYGRELKITFLACADNLASSAHLLFGEADEKIPAVLIRGAKVKMTESETLNMTMPAEECLYMNIFKDYLSDLQLFHPLKKFFY